MTDKEALELKKGDKVIYNGKEYKVQGVRHDQTNTKGVPLVTIKCTRKDETLYYLQPQFIEKTNEDDDFHLFVYLKYGISLNKESIKFIPDAELKKYEEEWKAWKENNNGQNNKV